VLDVHVRYFVDFESAYAPSQCRRPNF
jgi:hypothetical protein